MTAVLEALNATLPTGQVVSGETGPLRHRNDWSGLPPSTPLAIVWPRDPGEVAAILRLCSANRQKVVPQGGLTGLCGGARAAPDELALSLDRLAGIEEVDADAATITVRAGTTLQQVQEAAAGAGLMLPLDLGARGSCAIGGNIATNAGGNRVIRYGMTRELVLGLEAVLPDGTVLSGLNKMLKNNAGFDLKQLFVGSEGTLGVVTRAVLRLFPQPACTMAALCGLRDYAAVVRLLRAARAGLGPILSAFEVMWDDYHDIITTRVRGIRAPLGSPHPLYVLVEAQGSDDAADPPRFERWLERMLEDGVIADAAVAQSVAEVQAFWALRDAAAEFGPVVGPHVSYDIGLPVASMADYRAACRRALEARFPGIAAVFYGHVGDGNLHIMVHVPGEAAQPKDELDRLIYDEVQRHGGTVSAEHGIGTRKKPWLRHARTGEEVALMRTLKQALDPLGILNPGKVI